MPPGLSARPEDNWRPLLTIAEFIGEHWPERTRRAAEELGHLDDDDTFDLEQLLRYIKVVLDEHPREARFRSTEIVTALTEREDWPWARLKLNENELARRMTFHKRILEWQAEHPNITWLFWIVVWTIAILLIIWPRRSW